MKIRCVISLAFFFASAVHGMELALPVENKCKQIIFSEIPNNHKMEIISPILKEMKGNFASINNFLFEAGLDRSNDRLLANKIITFLAKLHNMPTGTLAVCVNTEACRRYMSMGESLMKASTPQFFDGSRIRELLANGADVNYEAYGFGNTPLMNSVYFTNPSLVAYFLRMGADVESYNCWGNTARDFNLIYNTDGLLRQLVVSIRRYKNVIKNLSINKQHHSKAIAQQVYNLPASKVVRKALRVDKILESRYNIFVYNRIPEIVIPSPLVAFTKIFRRKKALIGFLFDIFGGNVSDCLAAVPQSMRQYLRI